MDIDERRAWDLSTEALANGAFSTTDFKGFYYCPSQENSMYVIDLTTHRQITTKDNCNNTT